MYESLSYLNLRQKNVAVMISGASLWNSEVPQTCQTQTQVIVESFSSRLKRPLEIFFVDQTQKKNLCFDHANFAVSPNGVVQSVIAARPNQNISLLEGEVAPYSQICYKTVAVHRLAFPTLLQNTKDATEKNTMFSGNEIHV